MQVTSLPEIFDSLRRQLTRRSISNSANRRSGKIRRDDHPITWGKLLPVTGRLCGVVPGGWWAGFLGCASGDFHVCLPTLRARLRAHLGEELFERAHAEGMAL